MKRACTEGDAVSGQKKIHLSARQLLERLSENLSEALKELVDLITVQKDILFLEELLQVSPLLDELYAIIERSSLEGGVRLKDSEWHLIIEALHAVTMIAFSDTTKERLLVAPLLRKFMESETVQKSIMHGLGRANTSARIRTRLRLLALSASLDDTLAKICAKIFLPEPNTWKWLLNRRDSKLSEDIRATTIALICALLNSRIAAVVSCMMQKKGILRYTLSDLQYDSHNSVNTLCVSMKQGILTNPDMSKTAKIEFFTCSVVRNFCQALTQWTGVAGWQNKAKGSGFVGVDPEERQLVCSTVTNFLCLLLCSCKHGIRFAEEGLDDQRNHPVLNILMIMPLNATPCVDVVCRVLSISPRLCERYLDKHSSQPRGNDETAMLQNINFVSSLLKGLKYSIGRGIVKQDQFSRLYLIGEFASFDNIQTAANPQLIVAAIDLVCDMLELGEGFATEGTLTKFIPSFSFLLSLSRDVSTRIKDNSTLLVALQRLVILYSTHIQKPTEKVILADLKWAFKFILPKHMDEGKLIDFMERFNLSALQSRNVNYLRHLFRPLFSLCARTKSSGKFIPALTKLLQGCGYFDHNTFELSIWFEEMLLDRHCAKRFAKIVFQAIANCHPFYDEIFSAVRATCKDACIPIVSSLKDLSSKSLDSLRRDMKNDCQPTDYDRRVPFSILLPAAFDFLRAQQKETTGAFELALERVTARLLIAQPGPAALSEYLRRQRSTMGAYKHILSLLDFIEMKPQKLRTYLPTENSNMRRCLLAWNELMSRHPKGHKHMIEISEQFGPAGEDAQEDLEVEAPGHPNKKEQTEPPGLEEIWARLTVHCPLLAVGHEPKSVAEASSRLAQLPELGSLVQSLLTSPPIDKISLKACVIIAPCFKQQECFKSFGPLFSWAAEQPKPDLEELIVGLLIISLPFCASELNVKQAQFWLSRYRLTMSVHQQKILQLLWLYDVYLDGSLLNLHSFCWMGRAETSLTGCLFNLQPEMIERSIVEFPDFRTLMPRTPCQAEFEDIYDPAFLVPYIYHCFSQGTYLFECRQLCERGIIGYCCRALSSRCRLLRTIAMLALANLESNLQEQNNKDSIQLCFFLRKLTASVIDKRRIDTFITQMLAGYSRRLCNPASVMFAPICKNLKRSMLFRLYRFPMYMQWFLSSKIKAVEQRRFVIHSISGGLTSPFSYALVKDKVLHGLLSMLFAPDWLISREDRNCLLLMFCRAVRRQDLCRLLIEEQALPVLVFLIRQAIMPAKQKSCLPAPSCYDTFSNDFERVQILNDAVNCCMSTMEDFYRWPLTARF